MAKKSKSEEKKQYNSKDMPQPGIQQTKEEGIVDNLPPSQPVGLPPLPKLTKEQEQKLKEIKEKLEKFQKKITEKFDKYIMGVALMPPPRPKEGEKIDKDRINVLVLVDDSDSKKMAKFELKKKLLAI